METSVSFDSPAPTEFTTSLMSQGNYKSASVLNILPFILLYILHNHQDKEKEKSKPKVIRDKLYDYIPDKSKQFNTNIKYFLLVFPLIALLFKSDKSTSLEHTFVLLSHAVGIKSLMYFMTPSLPKQEFLNIIVITLVYNLIYFGIIPRDHRSVGLAATFLYSMYLISTRETTSANIIIDYSVVSLVFLAAKLN